MLVTVDAHLTSPIIRVPASQHLEVFFDAGGWPSDRRVWGGLAVLQPDGSAVLDGILGRARARVGTLADCHELKGGMLDDDQVEAVRQDVGRVRSCFWAFWSPGMADDGVSIIRDTLRMGLTTLTPRLGRYDYVLLKNRYESMRRYLQELKPVNAHKLASIVAHIQWLADEVRRCGIGSEIGRASLTWDRENLPHERECSQFVKAFFAAALQGGGMSYKLSGGAILEDPNEGYIRVKGEADSASCAGLQLVDILLQRPQRHLSSFGASRART